MSLDARPRRHAGSGKSAHAEADRGGRRPARPLRGDRRRRRPVDGRADRRAPRCAGRPAGTTVEAGDALADGLAPGDVRADRRPRRVDRRPAAPRRRLRGRRWAGCSSARDARARRDRASRPRRGGGRGDRGRRRGRGRGRPPVDAASRAWLDLLGEATQRLSAAAQRVELVVAGRALALRHPPPAPRQKRPMRRMPAPRRSLRRHGDRDVRPGDADHAVNVIAGGPPAWLRAALDAALDEDAGRYPDESAATPRSPRCTAATRTRSSPPTAPRRRCGCCPRRCARPSPRACTPASPRPRRRCARTASPSSASCATPDAGFALDPGAVPDEADLVVLGNPASPSGTLDPAGGDPGAAPSRAHRRRRRGVHGPRPRAGRLARARAPRRRRRRAQPDQGARRAGAARRVRRRRARDRRGPARRPPAVVGQRACARRARRRRRPAGRARRDRRAGRDRARRPRRPAGGDRRRAHLAERAQLLPRRGRRRRGDRRRGCASAASRCAPPRRSRASTAGHLRITARDPEANAALVPALAQELAR